ncbi:1-phosphofructokinase [Clostridium sp. CT7]|nr:1-phosphofructokinase [Clostridium sp. CT7]
MNIRTKSTEPNAVNRTESVKYFPNGKGINVSLVLNHFGMKSTIFGFFGGFSGNYIVDELKKSNFNVKPLWIEGITRINVFISDGTNEFKYVNKGAFVPEEEQEKFINYLKASKDCECLIISGSLSPGIDKSYYKKILEICNHKSIKCILDISTPELKNLLKYKPLLIKPNDEEVKKIFDLDIKNEDDAKKALIKISSMGAQNILLTLGDKGMYFYDGNKMYYCDAVKVKLVSSACAGDACLAAFLSEWFNSNKIEYALKKASAAGANVAESDGLGKLDKIDEYIKQLNVREVK